MKYVYIIVLTFMLLFGSFSYAKIPDEIISKKTAVVTIYIEDNDKVIAYGSGFIIDASGIIVTNYHVIEPWNKSKTGLLYIKKSDGKFLEPIEIIASDKVTDVALIKVKEGNLPIIKMTDDYKPVQGDDVVVIGTPLGFETTVSNGIVSGIRGEDGFLQISAPISSGSSGSPVLNSKGEAIGVATLVIDGGQNLNFAIPVSYVRNLSANEKKGLTKSAKETVKEAPPTDATTKKHRGKVLIKIDSEGYTYIKCDVNGVDTWIAMPTIAVNVGEIIEFNDTPPIINFESKTLRMKFEKISFVTGIWVFKDEAKSSNSERQELLNSLKKYVEASDYDGAIQSLDALIALSPTSDDLYYQRASIILESRKIYDDSPGHKEGELVDNKELCQAAFNDLSKAISLNPNVEMYYSTRALLLTDMLYCNYKANNEAITDYKSAIKLNPKNISYHKALGEIYIENKDYKMTILCANRLIELYPKEASGYFLLGRYHAEINDYSKALEYYKKGLSFTEQGYFYSLYVSEVIDKTKRYEYGIKLYSDLIKKYPKRFYLYFGRAAFYMKNKEYKKAIVDYTMLINNNTNNQYNYRQRADCYYADGDKIKSLADYQSACQLQDGFACKLIPAVEADIKRGDNWNYISDTDVMSYYYDKKTYNKSKSGIVSAWIRKEVTNKDEYIKSLELASYQVDKYKNISHVMQRVEADCNNQTMKWINMITYGENGNVIDSFDVEATKFKVIIPGSIGASTHEKLCTKTTLQKTSDNKVSENKKPKK